MILLPRTQQWRAAAAANPRGFGRKKIHIPDLMGNTVPFEYNFAQVRVSEWKKELHKTGKPVRGWVLKYRRAGISMLETFENFCYMYGNDNARVGILAHLESRAQELLEENVKLFHECLAQGDPELALIKSKDNIQGLKYKDTNAQMLIATAENAVKIRGGGIHRVQLTEGAWYFNLFNDVLEELGPVIPAMAGSQSIIETTGTLIGSQPYQHWLAAKTGQNEYLTYFLRWLDNPELAIPFENDYQKHKLFERIQEQEPRLLELCKFFKLTPEQIHQAWIFYHFQSKNNYDIFCREFPFTEDMAWTTGGDSYFGVGEIAKAHPEPPKWNYVFDAHDIQKIFKDPGELRAVESLDDYTTLPQLKIWELPVRGEEYILGSDSSYATAGGDYSAGYVINKRTRAMMAAYHGLIRPDEAAHIIVSLCRMYNNALAAPETNPAGGGYEALNCIQRLGYHRIYSWRRRDGSKGVESSRAIGWWTTPRTRPLMLGELCKIFQDAMKNRISDPGMFRDVALINEMRTFGMRPDGTPGANANCKDDRVFAAAIAHQVANDETYCTKDDKLLEYSKSTLPQRQPTEEELLLKRDPNKVIEQMMGKPSNLINNKYIDC